MNFQLAELSRCDPVVARAIQGELTRQRDTLELIASENICSVAVLEATGSIFTNKYSDGYPGQRHYGGCEYVDEVENLAIERAKTVFGAEHANVQPHTGTQANACAYLATLKPGDTILGMDLAVGGHITHGHPMSFSGQLYRGATFGLDPATELIDYKAVRRLALEHRPKIIVAGSFSYSRVMDWAQFRAIADEAGALLLVDMAHVAGLVAAGEYPSPVPYADIVTTTTHKTLRGPRGGLILCRAEHAQAIDRAVTPGLQGGPLVHVMAAKAVCLHEAMQPEYKQYQAQVRANARVLAAALQARGLRIVSGGTDCHLMIVDLTPAGISGRDAASWLEQIHVTCNKNLIPGDPRPPRETSGIRVGVSAITARGMGEAHMVEIADIVIQALETQGKLDRLRTRVVELCRRFPLYS